MGVPRYIVFPKRFSTPLIKYQQSVLNFISGRQRDSSGVPSDKKNFASLLYELRQSFNNVNPQRPLLLTEVVSARKSTIDQAYDVTAMTKTLDFINVMTGDYHGW